MIENTTPPIEISSPFAPSDTGGDFANHHFAVPASEWRLRMVYHGKHHHFLLFSDKQKIFCTDRILAELLDTCVMMLSTSRGEP